MKTKQQAYEEATLKYMVDPDANKMDLIFDAMGIYAESIAESAHANGWTKQLTTTDSWHNPSWLEFKEKHGI